LATHPFPNEDARKLNEVQTDLRVGREANDLTFDKGQKEKALGSVEKGGKPEA